MNDIELRRKKIATASKWGIGLVAALVLGPVAYLLALSLLGIAFAIVALGIAGVVAGTAIALAPAMAMRIANWKLKAIKYEAAANPVETLQNMIFEKEEAADRFADRIKDFSTEVKTFKDKQAAFKQSYPAEAEKFESTVQAMEALLQRRREKLRETLALIEQSKKEVDRVQALWDMSLAANAMTKAAGDIDPDFMDKIKSQTAFDSVQRSLNRALSELETSMDEEVPQLGHSLAVPSQVIDMSRNHEKVPR